MRWEFRKMRKDGAVIWVRETAQAVHRDEQPPVVLIVCEDITAMKEAEQALHDSEELKNQILRSSADCIKVLDLDGRLQYMNDAGQTLLRISDISAYVNKPWADFWRGDDRDAALAALEAAKAGEMGKFIGFCPTTTQGATSQRPTHGACRTRTSLPRFIFSSSWAPASSHAIESHTRTVSAGGGVSPSFTTSKW